MTKVAINTTFKLKVEQDVNVASAEINQLSIYKQGEYIEMSLDLYDADDNKIGRKGYILTGDITKQFNDVAVTKGRTRREEIVSAVASFFEMIDNDPSLVDGRDIQEL